MQADTGERRGGRRRSQAWEKVQVEPAVLSLTQLELNSTLEVRKRQRMEITTVSATSMRRSRTSDLKDRKDVTCGWPALSRLKS